MKMSLKLKLRPAKILETSNLAREHQLPADPWSNVYFLNLKINYKPV